MRTLVLIGTIVMVISCNNNIIFEDYSAFKNQTWNADSSVVFNYFIADTICKNKIVIKVRHTTDYEFQNLFLFVKAEKTDTIEILLANKEGMWLGKGIGDVREVEFEYASNIVFDKKGNLIIEIEQAMRYGKLDKIQDLNHISAVGLCIQKQDE